MKRHRATRPRAAASSDLGFGSGGSGSGGSGNSDSGSGSSGDADELATESGPRERGDAGGEVCAARVELRERERCPCCGSSRYELIWGGRFSDPDVRAFLAEFHYSADVAAALGDERFELVRCVDCELGYHRRILSPRWLSILYSDWIDSAQIEHFERRVRPSSAADDAFERARQHTKHVLRLKALLPSLDGRAPRLLDFGCGDGHFLALASLYGFVAFGVDFSTTRAARSARSGVTIVQSLEAYDALGGAPLDAISLFETLEHVDEPLGLLRALARRLRPGGVLIVEVPNCAGIERPDTLERFHAVQPLEHINAFCPDTLEALVARAGFRRIERPAAHVTTRRRDVARTEASRFVRLRSTAQYFRALMLGLVAHLDALVDPLRAASGL